MSLPFTANGNAKTETTSLKPCGGTLPQHVIRARHDPVFTSGTGSLSVCLTATADLPAEARAALRGVCPTSVYAWTLGVEAGLTGLRLTEFELENVEARYLNQTCLADPEQVNAVGLWVEGGSRWQVRAVQPLVGEHGLTAALPSGLDVSSGSRVTLVLGRRCEAFGDCQPTATPTPLGAAPRILLAGFMDTRLTSRAGGVATMLAFGERLGQVELLLGGVGTGLLLSPDGPEVFMLPPVVFGSGVSASEWVIELEPRSASGQAVGPRWPWLVVGE